jgi:hypothetical protein
MVVFGYYKAIASRHDIGGRPVAIDLENMIFRFADAEKSWKENEMVPILDLGEDVIPLKPMGKTLDSKQA